MAHTTKNRDIVKSPTLNNRFFIEGVTSPMTKISQIKKSEQMMKAQRLKLVKESDFMTEKMKKRELDVLRQQEDTQLSRQFKVETEKSQFKEYYRRLEKHRKLVEVQDQNWQAHEEKSERRKKDKLEEIEMTKGMLKEMRSKSTRMRQIELRQKDLKEWGRDLKE